MAPREIVLCVGLLSLAACRADGDESVGRIAGGGDEPAGQIAGRSTGDAGRGADGRAPPGALVVIKDHATLYSSIGGVPHVALHHLPDTGGRGHIAQVIAIREGYVHVRTVEPGFDPCAMAFGVESDLDLEMYVKLESLQTVLVRPKHLRYDDGTMLALKPGTPVDVAGPRAEANVYGTKLIIGLDDADIGFWYAQPDELEDPASPRQADTSATVRLRYGEHTIDAEGPAFVPTPGDADSRFSWRMQSFENSCGRFVLLVSDTLRELGWSPASSTDGSDGGRPAESRECPSSSWALPAATPLYWPDGNLAGVTRRRVVRVEHPRLDDVRACFDIGDVDLRVCTDRARVIEQDPVDDCGSTPKVGGTEAGRGAGFGFGAMDEPADRDGSSRRHGSRSR